MGKTVPLPPCYLVSFPLNDASAVLQKELETGDLSHRLCCSFECVCVANSQQHQVSVPI